MGVPLDLTRLAFSTATTKNSSRLAPGPTYRRGQPLERPTSEPGRPLGRVVGDNSRAEELERQLASLRGVRDGQIAGPEAKVGAALDALDAYR